MKHSSNIQQSVPLGCERLSTVDNRRYIFLFSLICNSLETELSLEEDQVLKWLTRFVSGHVLELVLEHGLESNLGCGAALWSFHLCLANPTLAVEILAWKSVSGWDDVVVVHVLDERLDSLSLLSLLLRHSLSDWERSLLNTDNQSVTVRSRLGTLIEDLNDDGLLTSLASLSEHNDSSCFNATGEIKKCDIS
jgi:hypothetical protein